MLQQKGQIVAILKAEKGKGIIETNLSLTTFWYRRTTEIAVLLCVLIAGIWALSNFVFTDGSLKALTVSPEVLVVLVITALGEIKTKCHIKSKK